MLEEDAVPDCFHNEVTSADKERYDHKIDFEYQEFKLQRQGAEIAISKLNEVTCDGRNKLSVMEWYQFLEIWNPHFETLPPNTKIHPWRERFCRR